MTENPALLKTLIKSLEDIQANDITVIDVHHQTTVTDYMIICTGRSSRHVKAVAMQVIQDMKQASLAPLHQTGLEGGDWALIDFGDYVVHVMQGASRAFYNLEDLWHSKH